MRAICDYFDDEETGENYKKLCMRCPGNSWDKDQLDRFNGWGPFNPSQESNYDILTNMFGELRQIFQDEYSKGGH